MWWALVSGLWTDIGTGGVWGVRSVWRCGTAWEYTRRLFLMNIYYYQPGWKYILTAILKTIGNVLLRILINLVFVWVFTNFNAKILNVFDTSIVPITFSTWLNLLLTHEMHFTVRRQHQLDHSIVKYFSPSLFKWRIFPC